MIFSNIPSWARRLHYVGLVGLLQHVVSEQLFLPGAGFVAEIFVEKDSKALGIKTNSSNRCISLCVPELSRLWYPFAVASTHNDKILRILFRRYGFSHRDFTSGFKIPPTVHQRFLLMNIIVAATGCLLHCVTIVLCCWWKVLV